ncbi:MAG: hypothetical protein COA78_17620 [Blastopirellula sp.]|nr:MAG: hypothetical protein COA78_17620 [Blastopirellula sp.]
MTYTKFIIAIVCLFAFTLEASACQLAPNTPSSEMGDDLVHKGNVIFVGVVSDIDFEQKPDETSCMLVKYKPSEMLFGIESKNFTYKVCGTETPLSSAVKSFQGWAEDIGIGIGNEVLVGLTKEPVPGAKENPSFEPYFRIMFASCWPLSARLDLASEEERKNMLNNARKMIREYASR